MSETELTLAFLVGFLGWPVLEKVLLPRFVAYMKGKKFLSRKGGEKQ